MSTMNDLAAQRERLTERLARIDTERAKVAEQLAELEAAERVLSRLSSIRPATGRRTGRPRKAKTEAGPAVSDTPKRRSRRA
jgi:hypothetical protein